MVFNSLGSNYNFEFIKRSLTLFPSKDESLKLKNFLEEKYDGKAILLYKGREAIKLALLILSLPRGSKVGVCAFTCFAVRQAVTEAGYTPEFIDIDPSTLNFGIKEIKSHPQLKVIIIQNTLGIPCDIESILDYCKENGIYLIEDLAHSVGISYKNGKEAGTCGDFTTLSFSQDKMIDAVSGGALVIRNKKFQNKLDNVVLRKLSLKRQIIDRLYPIFTFKIRITYKIGIGKILHWFLKKIKMLAEPMPKGKITYHKLPDWYCMLVNYQFSKFDWTLKYRNQIASIYKNTLIKSPFGVLRFPLLVENRDSLLKFLKAKDIFISDIWYNRPVAQDGECPVTENILKTIVNLPTHINVTKKEAKILSAFVNKWLNINQK
jgi:perosamine synthetase